MKIQKFLEYNNNKLSRIELENIKVSQRKNSISYRLLELWQEELENPAPFDEFFNKIKVIINDKKTVASKYQRDFWNREFQVKPFKTKTDLYTTFFNIILKSEGYGVIDKKFKKSYSLLTDKEPQIGDYVICDDYFNIVKSFITINIGKIVDILLSSDAPYIVQYNNIPTYLYTFFDNEKNTRPMSRKEIIYFSPNKADVELYLQSKKYNI